MSTMFIPVCAIATVFMIVWIVTDPNKYGKALTFQYRENKEDILMCALSWLFPIGFVTFITWVVNLVST